MSQIRLNGIDAAHIGLEHAHWDQAPKRERRQPRRHRPDAIERLVRMLLPGRDPETCEVAVDFTPDGGTAGIVIRDATSGRVLLRVPLGDLAGVNGQGGECGLFFERRG